MSQPQLQRRQQLTPPDKGSFPLDHFGECTHLKDLYQKCMKENRNQSTRCRIQSRDYLQCRMDKNLMAKEDLKKLGFKDLP